MDTGGGSGVPEIDESGKAPTLDSSPGMDKSWEKRGTGLNGKTRNAWQHATTPSRTGMLAKGDTPLGTSRVAARSLRIRPPRDVSVKP